MALKWEYLKEDNCYISRNNVYCSNPLDEKLQALHIFVPKQLMPKTGRETSDASIVTATGKVYTSQTVPIIFYNDIGGYSECEPAMLTDRNKRYLEDGYVLVSVGARGRQSTNAQGFSIGKAPAALVDLKAAIRWLRFHKDEIVGDTDKIISVGTSAGGAMSSLLGVSGDCPEFLPYLSEIGAELSTSDSVFASQAYCPITNLENADMAYEWMFQSKKLYTFSPKSLPKCLSDEESLLSQTLADHFPRYVNSLGLSEFLGTDGRTGNFYEGILESLTQSLNKFLDKQPVDKKSLVQELDPSSSWTKWNKDQVSVTNLDSYVQHYIGRMKPCPAFDGLNCQTPENEVFGDSIVSHKHFSSILFQDLNESSLFEEEQARFQTDLTSDTQQRVNLLNPMYFLSNHNIEQNRRAQHFRICLGSKDADTSFAISRILYLALKKWNVAVDYQLIWGLGHCDADYREEFSEWVDACTK
ncbi:subtype B tannase [Streptococcus suis]